jgi:hypothetical protein
MDPEKLLTSGCRQKILKTLSKVKSINIMGLVTKINSTYIEVNRNIKILEQEGVLSEQRYGRVRMIILNTENPKTQLLLSALKILGSQTKPTTNNHQSIAQNVQESNATAQETL